VTKVHEGSVVPRVGPRELALLAQALDRPGVVAVTAACQDPLIARFTTVPTPETGSRGRGSGAGRAARSTPEAGRAPGPRAPSHAETLVPQHDDGPDRIAARPVVQQVGTRAGP